MSRTEDINRFINKKIHGLIAIADASEGKYWFSQLRKGAGKRPGEIPELLGFILQDMPVHFFEGRMSPSKEEWACYISMTLYALHQQGKDLKNQKMYLSGISLGSALCNLSFVQRDESVEERMLKRIKGVALAKNIEGVDFHLRQIVKLLSNQNIPMDYGMLAADLYRIQFRDTAYKTYLKWGEDFYREKSKNQSIKKQEDNYA